MAAQPSSGGAEPAVTDPGPPQAPSTRPGEPERCRPLLEQDTLTNHWFGLGDKLSDKGVDVTLLFTQVYQQNLHGGLSTHRHAGRYTGRYDLEATADLEKLLDFNRATIYAHVEGGWSKGLDPTSVGSLFNVNADAVGDHPAELMEFYYEQWFGQSVVLRVGKIDLTAAYTVHNRLEAFDGNAYANDENLQFLNGSLVNNPAVPFPDKTLGVMVHVHPRPWWYFSVAAADADGTAGHTGLDTAFHGPARFFGIAETGVVPTISTRKGPMPGGYRMGLWYDPLREGGSGDSGGSPDDGGLYLSCDQMVYKENPAPADTQGLGLFARYGYASRHVNGIAHFWSIGAQYQGLIPSRDQDVLAIGVGQGLLSESAGFTADQETALEAYYRIQLTPWLQITPSAQWIAHPGGQADVANAFVAGVRIGATF